MQFISTRGEKVAAEEAIIKGVDQCGGLFIPSYLPIFSEEFLRELSDVPFSTRISLILGTVFDELPQNEIDSAVENALKDFEDLPVVEVDDGVYILELWHGQSHTYKELSLAVTYEIVRAIKRHRGDGKKNILVFPTLGEYVLPHDGDKVAAFYPKGGLDKVSRLLLATKKDNFNTYQVNGRYEDIERALRGLDAENGEYTLVRLGSLNALDSIVIAAAIVSAYLDLLDAEAIAFGDKINLAVPSSDLDVALAGYYAAKMGLPINKIIVSANANQSIVSVFNDGKWREDAEFYSTMSPISDVLTPLNIERIAALTLGVDLVINAETEVKGKISHDKIAETLRDNVFEAGWADEEETFDAINRYFEDCDYVFDTATGVVASVYDDYVGDLDDYTPTIITSLQDPFKCPLNVYKALNGYESDEFKAMKKLRNYTALDFPEYLFAVQFEDEHLTGKINLGDIKETVNKID